MITEIKALSSSFTFNEGDTFFIDANVLILIHGGMNRPDETSKAASYSNFVKQLLISKCNLCISALNLQEVFHAIERMSYRIYLFNTGQTSKSLKIKQYRHISTERNKLGVIQQSIWNQVSTTYEIMDASIIKNDLADFLSNYSCHEYDPIDFLIAKYNKPMNYITDDKDFTNDSEITVYTYSV